VSIVAECFITASIQGGGNESTLIFTVYKGTGHNAAFTTPSQPVRFATSHAVQYDPFSGAIWVATGDRDDESVIGFFSKRQWFQTNVIASGINASGPSVCCSHAIMLLGTDAQTGQTQSFAGVD